jgi:transposase-like protein
MKKQSIHPTARTTPAIRKEIQEAPDSISNSELARKYNINRTTVNKWRKRKTIEDASHAPKKHWKKKLSDSDIEIIVQTRKLTNLAIDDLLEVVNRELSVSIGRSRLGEILKEKGLTEKTKREIKEFAEYEPGFIHIDCTYLPKIEGVQSKAFCAIDRVSKWAYVEVYERKTKESSVNFLKNLIERCPLRIHRILTDNESEFTYKLLPKNRETKKTHPFDELCNEHKIKHKLTKFKHPWTNGQVERFNKQMKDKTTKVCKYSSQEELREGIQNWVDWYNEHCQLKSIKRKTPNQFVKEPLNT